MKLKQKYRSMNGEDVWNIVVQLIKASKCFQSVTGISYEAEISDNHVYYKGGKGKRDIEGEEISKIDFVKAFDKIKSLNEINTNTIKKIIPNTLYRKRTPFIGLLFSAGIIEK
jgi:hypothetical protein